MKIPSHFQLVSSDSKGVKKYLCQKSFMYYEVHPDGYVKRYRYFERTKPLRRVKMVAFLGLAASAGACIFMAYICYSFTKY